ncbi:hypothetical protein [Paenibacillus sp. MY03]|nr:hypothetical protein [Paenibacillus sp. MY03]
MTQEQQLTLETRSLSSLSKVFPNEALADIPYGRSEALLNETFSF